MRLPSGYPNCTPPRPPVIDVPLFPLDVDLQLFALNLGHIEFEWFLFGAFGYWLDAVALELAMGGPLPVRARKTYLDYVTRRVIAEFGYKEVGHLRAIRTTVGSFPRHLIDLSVENFAKILNEAFGYNLYPPFDPYANSLNLPAGIICHALCGPRRLCRSKPKHQLFSGVLMK